MNRLGATSGLTSRAARRAFTLGEMTMYVALSALLLTVVAASTLALTRAARSRSRVLETRLPLLACLEALGADLEQSSSDGVATADNHLSICPIRTVSSDGKVLYSASVFVYHWDASNRRLSRFRLDSSELRAQGVDFVSDDPIAPSPAVLPTLRSSRTRDYELGDWQVSAEEDRLTVTASARAAGYQLVKKFSFVQ